MKKEKSAKKFREIVKRWIENQRQCLKPLTNDEMVLVSFNVEPSMIDVGDSANLSWVVTGTDTTLTIDNGIGNVGLIGSRIIMPTETTTFTLTATNSTSTKTATTQIIVRDETYKKQYRYKMIKKEC